MQLKNNEKRNRQFFYYEKIEGNKELTLSYIHIPGNATVEIDDKIFEAICKTKTTVSEIEEVVVPLDEETIGADVKLSKNHLTIKEYYDTGRKKEINMVRSLISSGKMTIVERPDFSMDVVNKTLNENGISIKDMSDEQKLALYNKLA